MGVRHPCPPVRNNIVTERHLFCSSLDHMLAHAFNDIWKLIHVFYFIHLFRCTYKRNLGFRVNWLINKLTMYLIRDKMVFYLSIWSSERLSCLGMRSFTRRFTLCVNGRHENDSNSVVVVVVVVVFTRLPWGVSDRWLESICTKRSRMDKQRQWFRGHWSKACILSGNLGNSLKFAP